MGAPRQTDRLTLRLPFLLAACLALAGASPAAADTLTLSHKAEYPASAPSTERMGASGTIDQALPPGSGSPQVWVFTEDLDQAPYSACAPTYLEERARSTPSMTRDPFADPAGYEASSPVRSRWWGSVSFTDHTARSGPFHTMGGSLEGGQFWWPARYRLCGYLTVGDETRATATGQITVVGTGGGPDAGDDGAAEQCEVPRLLGLTLAKAKARLIDAGCRLGAVVKMRSGKKKGTIVGQSPKAGQVKKLGAAVNVVVSRGAKKKS